MTPIDLNTVTSCGPRNGGSCQQAPDLARDLLKPQAARPQRNAEIAGALDTAAEVVDGDGGARDQFVIGLAGVRPIRACENDKSAGLDYPPWKYRPIGRRDRDDHIGISHRGARIGDSLDLPSGKLR